MAGSPPFGRMKQTTTPPAAFLSKQASGLLLFRSSSFVGKKKQTMSDCLPKEVITDILSRLPVKSLMRFRCVSKAWCSLISTPNFISTHLNRSLSNSPHQPYLFVCHCWTLHTVLLYPSDPEIEQKDDFFANPSDRIELRDPSNNEYSLHLVGSSNGLLCLATLNFDDEVGLCVLWNPSIQKAIYLPKPNLGFDRSLNKSFGFGYEPTTDDYKLVRLVYPDTDYIGFKTGPPLVEIYTLRTGIWRSLSAPGPPYITNTWCSSIFTVLLSGAVHWPAHTPRRRGVFRNVIVSFNMKEEAFGEVGMPKSLQELEDLNVTLALRDGLLALVPCNEFGNKASHSVWVMKEYGVEESWTKLFDVRIGGFHRLIGFTKSGEVLAHKAAWLFSFGPSSGGYVKDFPIHHLEHIYLDTYVESLVLLNVADRIPRRLENSSEESRCISCPEEVN